MASIQFNRVYRLSNVQSGTCLDLSGMDHHSIVGYQQGSGANQMWMFQEAPGAGNYYIKSVSKGEYMSIADVPSNGKAVVASPTPFAWNIKSDSDALGIYIPGSNYCIDLDRGSSALGTKIQVWSHWGGKNQLWKPIMVQ